MRNVLIFLAGVCIALWARARFVAYSNKKKGVIDVKVPIPAQVVQQSTEAVKTDLKENIVGQGASLDQE